MSIVPDADWKCRQKTKTVPDSKNPVFHEHFVFPVKEEDEQKRLLVTVWNRERNSRSVQAVVEETLSPALVTPCELLQGPGPQGWP
ncbi:hypothetical protein DV515_00008944 [Chloebia gouldiae]|uniref:C2 domain-containing protein n=1 Tax=Chloebia gouldiae TaxID=44316 RepID=A0A3L8SDR6_CHLGU|nr:hypothetical protein DV515_00008944 [Chloebia gouldiae]